MKGNIIYNKKTGREYKFIESYNDKEMIVEDKKHNKIIIDKDNTINSEAINNLKTILKMLCKNGEISIDHDKYSNSKGTFFSTSVYIGNQKVLYDKIQF